MRHGPLRATQSASGPARPLALDSPTRPPSSARRPLPRSPGRRAMTRHAVVPAAKRGRRGSSPRPPTCRIRRTGVSPAPCLQYRPIPPRTLASLARCFRRSLVCRLSAVCRALRRITRVRSLLPERHRQPCTRLFCSPPSRLVPAWWPPTRRSVRSARSRASLRWTPRPYLLALPAPVRRSCRSAFADGQSRKRAVALT